MCNVQTLIQGAKAGFFQGRGSRAIFTFPLKGAQPSQNQFLVASMVKMKEFRVQGSHGPPLPMAAYAYALIMLVTHNSQTVALVYEGK